MGHGLQEHRVPGGRFKVQLQYFSLSTPPLEVTGTCCLSSRPLLHNPSHATRLNVPLSRALSLTGHPKQPGTWVPRTLAVGPRKLGLASEGPTLMNNVLAVLTWQDAVIAAWNHVGMSSAWHTGHWSEPVPSSPSPAPTGSYSWTCAADTADYPLVPLSPSTVQLCHWAAAARVTSSLLSREM